MWNQVTKNLKKKKAQNIVLSPLIVFPNIGLIHKEFASECKPHSCSLCLLLKNKKKIMGLFKLYLIIVIT